MQRSQQATVRNLLLQAMSPDDFALLGPHLQPMQAELRQMLIAPNEPISHLYFPEIGFTSITTDGSGSKVELGMIGREGLVGAAPLLLDVARSPFEHFVQSPGEVLCIATEALREAVVRSPSLHRVLLRYAHVLLVQTAQTAFANATHTLEMRLARWLLMCQDRLGGDEIAITHEFMAMMLAVQRTSVTLLLQTLEGGGSIRSRRGRIEIRSRDQLIALAGSGYGLPEAEYARTIRDVSAPSNQPADPLAIGGWNDSPMSQGK